MGARRVFTGFCSVEPGNRMIEKRVSRRSCANYRRRHGDV